MPGSLWRVNCLIERGGGGKRDVYLGCATTKGTTDESGEMLVPLLLVP